MPSKATPMNPITITTIETPSHHNTIRVCDHHTTDTGFQLDFQGSTKNASVWATTDLPISSSSPSALSLAMKEGVSGAYMHPSKCQEYGTSRDNNTPREHALPSGRRSSTSTSAPLSNATLRTSIGGRPVTRPIPISHALLRMADSPSPTTSPDQLIPAPTTASSFPTPTPRRAIHKKPCSYDLRDDFAHHAPQARAALAEFYSRRAEPQSAGGSGGSVGTRTHWSTASAPQLQRQASLEAAARAESRGTRSWPMKGGQLLH